MIRCTACGYQIPAAVFASSREGACPLCRRPVQAVLLPAMSQAPKAASPPMLPEEPPAPGEATCFYSPNRRATHTCSHCGVYVSDAWSAQWGTDYVCLKCLDDLRGHRKDARFEVRRVLWDNIALGTALLPFLICVPLLLLGPAAVIFIAFPVMASVITAPLALAFSIYAWKKPRSMVPRGAARTVWALVLSLLQCGAWGAFIFAALSQTFLR
ncbi:hypothetical protein [Roseimicrobium gellanilyticum]|nr:hypothetical protein [Roseimicrobium gellanilyticum]